MCTALSFSYCLNLEEAWASGGWICDREGGRGIPYILKGTGRGVCTVYAWEHTTENECSFQGQLFLSLQSPSLPIPTHSNTYRVSNIFLSLLYFFHLRHTRSHRPEDSRLPLLPLIILPLLPMLASLEVFKVPVSVRSIAISLRLRAAWIFDYKDKKNRKVSKNMSFTNTDVSQYIRVK